MAKVVSLIRSDGEKITPQLTSYPSTYVHMKLSILFAGIVFPKLMESKPNSRLTWSESNVISVSQRWGPTMNVRDADERELFDYLLILFVQIEF